MSEHYKTQGDSVMNKKVFDYMLEDANNFSTGDLWVINFEDKNIYFNIQKKSRWWIEAYCLEDHTNYRISRKEVK